MKNMRRLSFVFTLILCSFIFVGCGASNNTNKSLNDNLVNESNENSSKETEDEKDKLNKLEEDKNNLEENKESIEENKYIINEEISSKNKNGIKIVLDPGHSKKPGTEKEKISPDSDEMKLKDTSGSVGLISKKNEYEIAMDVTLKLKELLERDGYTVVLTKDNAETLLSSIERAEVGNKENANLMIRIHCDSFSNSSAKGASMLVPKQRGYITKEISEKSIEYGKNIIEEYTKKTGLNNRGLQYRSDLTGFNWSKIPVVLLELGFISNPEEDKFLSSEENISTIAEGIKNGIEKINFK
ncbi:N-acetylmuramoyl-L-alanine amidase AmiA precursor [Clostridium thermobutyricum DSM 4928]|uniref:N-acetylmuramoyl-L-alanine amidase AmiA n=2 Tax=Clostridium thermobutyricum TaxID=29372 RepID=A0A1V4SU96_9CLOT|nr:N-acetylmuramoyl-L-alanine amidase AmiA precursor [Clostridium thermobutyricum DSM 4928]